MEDESKVEEATIIPPKACKFNVTLRVTFADGTSEKAVCASSVTGITKDDSEAVIKAAKNQLTSFMLKEFAKGNAVESMSKVIFPPFKEIEIMSVEVADD